MNNSPSSEFNTEKSIEVSFQFNRIGQREKAFKLNLDLTLPGKGVTAIFGRSGSGKTTLLRCMAGLEQDYQGIVSVNGDKWESENFRLPTHKRALGYVFQEPSLFEHLTGRKNLEYAVKRSKDHDSPELQEHVIEVLGIRHILDQYPSQMSGGEQQRIAIARALLVKPKLLLMDEPLSSLDYERKSEILPYLERIKREFDIPILYVSHSLDEVVKLADHVVVLQDGHLIAQGSLRDVFSRIDLPMNFGEETSAVLDGEIMERDEQWHLSRFHFTGGDIWVSDKNNQQAGKARIRILAKDISIALSAHEDCSILNRVPCVIADIADDQDISMSLLRLQCGEDFLVAKITKKSLHHLNLQCGMKVWAQIKSAATVR